MIHFKDLRKLKLIKSELTVADGLIMRGDRMVIPRGLQEKTMTLAHEAHLGIVKT